MKTLLPLRAFCVASLIAATASSGFAQSTGSVSGVVRDQNRQPIAEASVAIGSRGAFTDSLGRYRLDSVALGRVRVVARRVGFQRRDTTILLRAAEAYRWDVTLGASYDLERMIAEAQKQAAEAEKQEIAAGKIDSMALGLIRPNPGRALPLGTFGARLFASLVVRRGADSNTVFSPLSAGLALSLVRLGALGQTATTLDRLLGLTELDRATIEQRGSDMMADFSRRTDVTLETANAVWVDTAAVLTDVYRASTQRWRATGASLPLSSRRTVDVMNRWADSVTHKKISSIIRDPLPDSTRLFIANAVYFKGKWLTPFAKSATKPGDFTLPSGKRITVPRMEVTAGIRYWRGPDYQMIRLPYRTGKTAMYIVLPDSGVSFNALVSRIGSADWMSAAAGAGGKVHVVLPRFRSELTLNLGESLQDDLGARLPFACGKADFSAMARARIAGRDVPLCIGAASQKVYIDVDEEGTEAAAITASGMAGVTAYIPPTEFIVDRPFLFVLRDEVTGADLFVGRIARP